MRETQSVDGHMHWVQVLLDGAGHHIEKHTSLGHHERVERDPLGRPRTTTFDASYRIFHDIDPMGREIERRLPGGGRMETTFDSTGRLTRRRVTTAARLQPNPDGAPPATGEITTEQEYRYDSSGRLVDLVDHRRGLVHYENDPAGRLVARTGEDRTERFRYDPAGNWVGTAEGPDRVFGPGNLLRQNRECRYVFDGEGRLIERGAAGTTDSWKYDWNAAGLLESVVKPDGTLIGFAYDGLARRVRKRVTHPSGESRVDIRFVWDGNRLIHEIRTEAHGGICARVTQRTYCYHDGSLAPAAHRDVIYAEGRRHEGEWFHYVNDAIGTPERLVTADGRVACELIRSAWGRTLPSPQARTTTPLRFLGQYEDEETGLFYNRCRFYDPDDARYISADPKGPEGNVNAFAYVPNPSSYVDPMGLVVMNATSAGGAYVPSPPDVPGTNTLVVHGDDQGTGIWVPYDWGRGEHALDSEQATMEGGRTGYLLTDPERIKTFIEAQFGETPGWRVTPFRLVACNGAKRNLAQLVSRALMMKLTAATEVIWASGGTLSINGAGIWRAYAAGQDVTTNSNVTISSQGIVQEWR